jgi:UDP-glucose 4-epimerase
MRAFVTGIAGFVGSNLARTLVDSGWRVSGLDNFTTGTPANIPTGVDWDWGDITDPMTMRQWHDADCVFHTAAIARSTWEDKTELMHVNFKGTQNVIDFAESRGAVLVNSASSVCAMPQINDYALSKWMGEREVTRADFSGRVSAVSLRYGNVYGPGQSQEGAEPNVLAAWLRSMREHGWVRVDGDGTQTRDFVHVDDVVLANIHAFRVLNEGIYPRRPVDICTGYDTSLNELAEKLQFPTKPGERRYKDPDEIPQDPYGAWISLGWIPRKPHVLDYVHEILR